MIKAFTLILLCSTLNLFNSLAQTNGTTASLTSIKTIEISRETADKPQSKVWKYACTYWAVMPDAEGTHIWRLDGTTWTKAKTISPWTSAKADCKMVGNVTHILLFRGGNTNSHLISVEYAPSANSYDFWTQRATPASFQQLRGTATIDIDSKGRMWLASNGVNEINIRWSDAPYAEWSEPITLESGIELDDLGAVVALPGKVGVFWSNQSKKRFGFRTHTDGEDPSKWSSDEAPAAASALNVGDGMADDHMNMAVAKDGTMYCAVKTGYNKKGFPQVALLIRRPNGTWDDLYGISDTGTRPIVMLNEELGNIKMIYSETEGGGDILYTESPTSEISFGPVQTLIEGKFDNATSTKHNYDSETVILATNDTRAAGVVMKTSIEPAVCITDTDRLFTAFPNPFSARTYLHFSLLSDGDYTLTLFDNKGAKISVLGKGTAEAFVKTVVQFDANHLPRGLYMVRLEAPGVTKSIKLIHEQ